MSKLATFTLFAYAATSAAVADELTFDNKFQWPAEMRFDPLKVPAPPLPPPSLVDQLADTYQKMPVRPAYVPSSRGGFGLQFHKAF
jgi:hypothetical protein